MTGKNTGFTWENNYFWKDIKCRLEKSWTRLSGEKMTIDKSSGWWKQECKPDGASLPALLQNKYLAADFTDRGFGICPMVLNGRYYGRIGFDIICGDKKFTSHPFENTGRYEDIKEMSAFYGPDGTFTIRYAALKDSEYEIKISLPPSYPFILVEVKITCRTVDSATITPWLLWMPGKMQRLTDAGILWITPEHIPIADRILANNNSQTADPIRPEDTAFAGIGAAFANGTLNLDVCRKSKPDTGESIILCDRLFLSEDLEKLTLSHVHTVLADGKGYFSMVLGINSNVDEFKHNLAEWRRLGNSGQNSEKEYWKSILASLSINCADSEIERQSAYSVRNSLFSRSIYKCDKTVFIHGRPDRGYGDCSKLHQSYQMHYVALASGQSDSVKEELTAFASLQQSNGDMAVQLRPGGGFYPYAGLYSNAHFIMALYRYLIWTGDFDFINRPVSNPAGTGMSILDSALLSARWLLDNFSGGVVKPCGWLDAWPPEVKAQAQISIAAYIALDELAKILAYIGRSGDESYFRDVVFRLGQDIKSVFYNKNDRLFAEHLFESGKVEGGVIEDFWAHTQIWAALAGLAPDAGGLEKCRRYCLKRGMTVIPETGINTGYIADSTDGLEDLDIGSTATWLFAVWPELTHLYAIAELRYGRISEALEAVRQQLPQHVHEENRCAVPYYYAEKYLYPYSIPWLCTWSGDPTFIQVLVEGFGGVHPSIEGLCIKPAIPDAWGRDKDYIINFIWRGRKIHMTVAGSGRSVKGIELNGCILEQDKFITCEMLAENINVLNVTM